MLMGWLDSCSGSSTQCQEDQKDGQKIGQVQVVFSTARALGLAGKQANSPAQPAKRFGAAQGVAGSWCGPGVAIAGSSDLAGPLQSAS